MFKHKWTLKEIVEHAKTHSPFYRKLFQGVTFKQLSDLPILDQSEFWKSEKLTSDRPDGIVFKSGGSTGSPKYSYFTTEEWQSFTEAFGMGMAKGILENGDRVANLFYAGDLYASFLFIKDSLASIKSSDKKILHFPVAGATDAAVILKTLEEFNINVLAGVPSAMLKLVKHFEREKKNYPHVKLEKILFGGEVLYPDQRQAFTAIFPGIKIASIGCASVDGGPIGYCDASCADLEHRVFDDVAIIEIVDCETLEVITEANRIGKLLLTNLTRKLMPIIRYPAGDLAMWVESAETPNRKFKLQGRADEAARLGTISVYFEDMRLMIMKELNEVQGLQFQMLLLHFDHKDELTLKIAAPQLVPSPELIKRLREAFKKEKPVYPDILSKNLIHPLNIEIVGMNELESNPRTGKLKRIIDNRLT